MKKIFIIFVFAIVLCSLFLFGCPKKDTTPPVVEVPANITTSNETNTTVPPVQLGPCEDKQNVLEKDACLKDLAVSNSDKSVCAKIYSVEIKDDCIYSFVNQSVSVCDELSDAKKKDSCLDFHARSEKSLSLCDRIGQADVKQACVNAVSPPCLAIVDKKERETCTVIADKNLAGCNDDQDCLFAYGTALNDTAACDKIDLNARRVACRSFSTGSVKCKEELTLDPDIGYCFEAVAIKANDVYYCERIPEASSYSPDCYTALAIQQKNASYCKKAAMENDANDCLVKYALATGEYQWCSNITYYMSSLRKDGCYRQAAIKFNDPLICNGIPASVERASCYGLVLSSDLPFKLESCDGIVDPQWKDTCYYHVAVQMNNQGICSMITSNVTKMNCNDKFIS